MKIYEDKEVAIKCINGLDETMLHDWFPLNLRDRIFNQIFLFFEFSEEELERYKKSVNSQEKPNLPLKDKHKKTKQRRGGC